MPAQTFGSADALPLVHGPESPIFSVNVGTDV